MATEKVLKARLQNKYETLENWNALPRGSFIPLKGELCLASDKDNAYGYYKVGDGETDFVDLPWLLNQGNWNENDKNTPGYVKNRPMYTEIPEDAEAILEIGYKSGDEISEAIIVEGTTAIMGEGGEFTREDASKAWEFKVNIKSDNDINPIDLFIEGPIYLKEINIDDDIIYYYGNFYRFYLMYAISELEEEIASGEITVEQIEQILQEQLQLQDTGENYAFVNMYGTFFAVAFDQTPGDVNNFTYEFNIYSYTTIVHKLDSKYLEEVNLVGKFDNIDNFSEIFNDYANNQARGSYTHAEGKNTVAQDQAAHSEGENTQALGAASHAEGYGTYVSPMAQGAHAEGEYTTVSGSGGHAEGWYTHAYGYNSHAEGQRAVAYGNNSHAEGEDTIASGDGSHAEGGNLSVVQEIGKTGSYSQDITSLKILSKDRVDISGSANCLADIYYKNSNDKYVSFTINYSNGKIKSGGIDATYVEQGYIPNATCIIRSNQIGAVGEYSHVEGYGNTALGRYSHVEGNENLSEGFGYDHIEGSYNISDGYSNHIQGQNNTNDGSYNHIIGQYNDINHSNSYIIGENLEINSNYGGARFILGQYNEDVSNAFFAIGNGNSNNRKNALILDHQNNLQVAGTILNSEQDYWTTFKTLSEYARPTRILEEDCTFERSKILRNFKLKLLDSSSEVKINNGNMVSKERLVDQTLKNGTSMTVNDDYSLTINIVPSEEEQRIDLGSYFPGSSIDYNPEYYCWDETADTEVYYGFGYLNNNVKHINKGEHLISITGSSVTPKKLHLFIFIEPNISKTITLYPPVVGQNGLELDKWIPPSEPITLMPQESIEIDINDSYFNGRVGVEGYGEYTLVAQAVKESYINELRLLDFINTPKYNNHENQYIIDLTQKDSNISFIPGTTTLSLNIKLGQKIDGVWTSNYKGITSEQLELVELFPEAMQSLLIGDQNSGFKLPDGIFVNNTTDSEWSMPTRALYDLMSGGNIANITDGHVRLEHGYNEFDTCYLKWYIGLGDGTDEEIETLFGGIMAQLATATHFIFYLPHGRNNIYLN